MQISVLPPAARVLFDPFAFGTLSTINPDGGPQVTLTASFLDGEEIVLFHRGWYQKLRNIGRNPLVAYAVVPPITSTGSPGNLPPYLVVHGVARVTEGDAVEWSDRMLAIVRAGMPAGTEVPTPPMPDNGGWTTRITPTKLVGVGPWMSR